MNPKRKQRMILVSFLVVGFGLAVGLIMFSLTENINYFYNPTEIAEGKAPKDARIRAGGLVLDGSVRRDPESLNVSFVLTDHNSKVEVRYQGILPDLFREGQGIVALGRINDEGALVADEVLAKHDENYLPPEVAEALEKSGHPIGGPKPDGGSSYKKEYGGSYGENKDGGSYGENKAKSYSEAQ